MNIFHFTETFIQEDFKKALKQTKDKTKSTKLLAMMHLQQGKSAPQVSEMLKKSPNTIRGWLRRYNRGGITALLATNYNNSHRCKLNKAQQAELKEIIISRPTNNEGGKYTAKSIRDLIKDKYGVSYSTNSIYKLLHKQLDLSWITCRSKHSKSSDDEQIFFKI